jgi:hypothetical protein
LFRCMYGSRLFKKSTHSYCSQPRMLLQMEMENESFVFPHSIQTKRHNSRDEEM